MKTSNKRKIFSVRSAGFYTERILRLRFLCTNEEVCATNSTMADSCVREQIITDFLLNTCEPCHVKRQKNDDALFAWLYCAHIASLADKHEFDNIPLSTGSVAGFDIQPMLSCIGDIDIMYYRSTHLAVPAGFPPPTELPAEFANCVVVCEIIDSEFPGYVYLEMSYLMMEGVNGKYIVEQWPREYLSYHFADEDMHGPAYLSIWRHRLCSLGVFCLAGSHCPIEYVACVRCLSWPLQAADWPTRKRNYSWPESATLDRVVSDGCDVVHVAHRLCRDDEWMGHRQYRLSFSRAEVTLLNTWSPLRQIVYHVLRVFVKTSQLTESADNSGAATLSNYHIKTLMLWASEMKPITWWADIDTVPINTVRICVKLLQVLGVWLTDARCKHYFVTNCNLFLCFDNSQYTRTTASRLKSVTRASFCEWFINTYFHKCVQILPDGVSRLFQDISTNTELQNAVSAVVNWRRKTEISTGRLWIYLTDLQRRLAYVLSERSLHVQSWSCIMRQLATSYQYHHLADYFCAIALLNVAYKTKMQDSLNDEMMDVLLTMLLYGDFTDVRLYISARLSSPLSINVGILILLLVTDVDTKFKRNTVRQIVIELCKAYLYRALRLTDSDDCLANVYLAVLYYTMGQYQMAIDHCTLVTGSRGHLHCHFRLPGALLPKIDDDVDNVLGLAVFYQYIRTAMLSQEQGQRIVFTTELFAHYLHIKCLSATQCPQVTKMSSTDVIRQYQNRISKLPQMHITDLAVFIAANRAEHLPENRHKTTFMGQTEPLLAQHLDTAGWIELLQKAAVEYLTTFRFREELEFGVAIAVVTTDYEALYAYKCGEYQRCLQLSKQNIHMLIDDPCHSMPRIYLFPVFIQLMDDDIVSLTGLTLLVNPSCVEICPDSLAINQLSLSLYLMSQCQMKLSHPLQSLVRTLCHIKEARSRLHDQVERMDNLLLTFIEQKLLRYVVDITLACVAVD